MSDPLDGKLLSVPQYLYLTAVVDNFEGGKKLAQSLVRRTDGLILEGTHHYQVGIKKFSINSIQLPLWAPILISGLDTNCSITFINGAGTEFTDNIALPTATTEFKTWSQVVDVINTCFTNVNTLAGGAFPAPNVTFDNGLFTINTTAGFRGAFDIYFNGPTYNLFNTFEYETLSDDYDSSTYAKLILDADAVTQQDSTTLYFSPVNEIIVTTSLPIVPNLLPLENDNNSSNYQKILSDFKVFNENANGSTFSYQFTTNGGDINYHTMFQQVDVKEFSIQFKWVDYEGRSHDIYLRDGQVAQAQLVFRRNQ